MLPSTCLFIILDGLGDRQYPELDGQTPLQAEHTPNLDRLALLGGNGLYHPGCLGKPFPSESAHFTLFGYPQVLFPGRGPLEALGAGFELDEDEVAVLAHFVSAESRDGKLFVRQDRPEQVGEHEALDQALTPYMQLLAQDPEILTVIASDHSTPSSGPMIHSGEPVPVIMRAESIRRDQVQAFDEISAACGSLGLMRDTELFQMVLNGLKRAKMHGIREVATERIFWPGPAP